MVLDRTQTSNRTILMVVGSTHEINIDDIGFSRSALQSKGANFSFFRSKLNKSILVINWFDIFNILVIAESCITLIILTRVRMIRVVCTHP